MVANKILELVHQIHHDVPHLLLRHHRLHLVQELDHYQYQQHLRHYQELLHLLQCAGGAGAPLRLAFMAVIKGLKAARRWSDAFGALAQLRSAGLTPPLQACNMVLDACGKAGQLPHVFAVLQCLHECGVPPDTVTVTSLVDACGRAGALDHAREAWAWMRACGVRPNTYTFNAMIHTYAKAGALDHARAMLAEMETAPGCEPSTSTFTSIISACGRAGVLDISAMMNCSFERPVSKVVSDFIGGGTGTGKCGRESGWTRDGLHPNVWVYLRYFAVSTNVLADFGEACRPGVVR